MSVGEMVFNIANGYDADMWDDSLLIRQYDRAYQSSRELKKRRQEAGKKKRNWELGDACRVLYENDGLEYEANIVKIAGRKATVRLHGYKEELEVPVGELAESLGQQYILDQIAEAQMEVVTEDPYTGPVKVGEYCRALWSLDGSVYEGKIESILGDKVTVRFIGYENADTVLAEELMNSKGQEWRDLQIDDAEQDFEEKNNNFDVDINKLIEDNTGVLSSIPEVPEPNNLSKQDASDKVSKRKSKSSDSSKVKKDKSSKAQSGTESSKGDKTEKQSSKTKSSSKKESKSSKVVDPIDFSKTLPSFLNFPNVLGGQASSLPVPPLGLPDPLSMPNLQPGLANPLGSSGPFGTMTPDFSRMPQSLPLLGSLPNMSSLNLGGPSPMMAPPPPPPINPTSMDANQQQMLQSMLISWYMAGYHTGLYQGAAHNNKVKKKKEKKKTDSD